MLVVKWLNLVLTLSFYCIYYLLTLAESNICIFIVEYF